MKINENNPELFNTLSDIIPSINSFPYNAINQSFSQLDGQFLILIKQLCGADYSNFIYEYVSKSSDRKLSNFIKSILNDNMLILYNDFYSINNDGINIICSNIYNRFKYKWRKLYDTLLLDYNPIKPYDMTIHEESEDNMSNTTTSSGTNTSSSTDIVNSEISDDINEEKTYGFNSANATPTNKNEYSSKNNSDSTSTNTENKTSSIEYERTNPFIKDVVRNGNIGNVSQQELIERERKINSFQIYDILISDLNAVLTRSKYI